ncbi:MAG: transcriptional regulator FilR1 domain-containing protein [Methanolobus sp.]|nr:transcriptional regulator FilR1 domain-containing protein [Methanolobus sp.]
METILKSLKTSRQALLPQIRILENHFLVTGSDDAYELTALGELLIHEILHLLGTIEVFDGDTDYWGSHNLDFIPPHLLERIRELGKCKEVNLTLTESYQLNQETVETTFMSRSFFVITSFFHPNYPNVFPEMAQRGVKLYIIASRHVLDIMRTQHHAVFEGLIKNGSLDLFVYPDDMGFQVIAYNDYRLLLRLLTNEGEIDINHMICSNPGALEWAQELFEHYLKDSTPVTDLNLKRETENLYSKV